MKTVPLLSLKSHQERFVPTLRFSEPLEILLTVRRDSRSVRAGARDSRDGNQHSRAIGGVPCVKNSLLTVSSL
jgi:hypothetical protein